MPSPTQEAQQAHHEWMPWSCLRHGKISVAIDPSPEMEQTHWRRSTLLVTDESRCRYEIGYSCRDLSSNSLPRSCHRCPSARRHLDIQKILREHSRRLLEIFLILSGLERSTLGTLPSMEKTTINQRVSQVKLENYALPIQCYHPDSSNLAWTCLLRN